MRRRHFLTVTCGGFLVYSLDRAPELIAAQDGKVRVPLRFFTEAEARTVAAAAARIFPSDSNGPGAEQAGVVIYIDRQLASPYGRDRYRYRGEPFLEGPPEFGYQGSLTPAKSTVRRSPLSKTFQVWKRLLRTNGCERSKNPSSFNCCAATPSKACSAIPCMAATQARSAGS